MRTSARPVRSGPLRRLRRALIAVPLSLALGLGAMAVLAFYPLTRARAYEIRDALEARRGKVTE